MIWLVLLFALPMSGWATAQEAFQAVRYRLEVTYDATARTIQGHASFTAIWHGDQPLTAIYFFLPPNTLKRRDPREPAALSDLRYAMGFDAASLTVHQVTDGTQQELSFHLQDDQTVPVGRVPDQGSCSSIVRLIPSPAPEDQGAAR